MAKPKVVVVADPDTTTRTALCITIQEMGHEVLEALDGASAKVFIESRAVDLLIINLALGDVNGIDIIKRAGVRSQKTEVIALSDKPTPAIYTTMREMGVFRLIAKPIKLADISDAVMRALQSEGPQRVAMVKPVSVAAADSQHMAILCCDYSNETFAEILDTAVERGYSIEQVNDIDFFNWKLRYGRYDVLVISDAFLQNSDLGFIEKQIALCDPEPVVVMASDPTRGVNRFKMPALNFTIAVELPIRQSGFYNIVQKTLAASMQEREKAMHKRQRALRSKGGGSQTDRPHAFFQPGRKSVVLLYIVIILVTALCGYLGVNYVDAKKMQQPNSSESMPSSLQKLDADQIKSLKKLLDKR